VVQRDRKHSREVLEVVVSREDREVVTIGDGTDQEVRVGSLNALLSTLIEE
jgi:hypothetical protein